MSLCARPWFLRSGMMMALALAGEGWAQQADRYRFQPQDPDWFKMRFSEGRVGVYSEGVYERQDNGGATADYRRFFVGPLLGGRVDGSIYHPNLATYFISGEGAYGYSASGTDEITRESMYLGNLDSRLSVFNNKPFYTGFFGGYNHSFRDTDFFSRTIVDSWRYGVDTGYRAGAVPVTVSAWRRIEDNSSLNQDYTLDETVLNVAARNERKSGATHFSYAYNQSTQEDNYGFAYDNTGHSLFLGDSETFGHRRNITAGVGLSYSTFGSEGSVANETDSLGANANLGIVHTPALTSSYNASYNRTQSGEVTTESVFGSGTVTHQLYDSLTSTLTVEAEDYESSGFDSTSKYLRYGLGIGEGYRKKLGGFGRLRAGANLGYYHNDIETTGAFLTIIDEVHTFPTSGALVDTFALRQPNVSEGTIVVQNPPKTLTYRRNLDYTVSRSGQITYINRISGGLLPVGATVVVSYQADNSGSGTYETINAGTQVRVEFLNDHAGVFAGVSTSQNNAPEEVVAQDMFAYNVGADYWWRFLRVGVRYDVSETTFSDYNAWSTFEHFSFGLEDGSAVSLAFDQSWIEYVDANRDEQRYSFISRYNRALAPQLHWNVEAGLQLRYGEGVDQTLGTFRTELQYTIGRVELRTSYNFEYDRYLETTERMRHLFLVRVVRRF